MLELGLAVLFLIAASISGLLGYHRLIGAAANISKLLFVICILLTAITAMMGLSDAFLNTVIE